VCWDLGRTNSPTSARHEDGLGYIKILTISPRRLFFWDGSLSPSIGIRDMPELSARSTNVLGISVDRPIIRSSILEFKKTLLSMFLTFSLYKVVAVVVKLVAEGEFLISVCKHYAITSKFLSF